MAQSVHLMFSGMKPPGTVFLVKVTLYWVFTSASLATTWPSSPVMVSVSPQYTQVLVVTVGLVQVPSFTVSDHLWPRAGITSDHL